MHHRVIWNRVSERRYDEMLGVVPPALQTVDGFLVGEPWTHRRCGVSGQRCATFMAFVRIGDEYFACGEALTIREFRAVRTEDVLATARTDSPL